MDTGDRAPCFSILMTERQNLRVTAIVKHVSPAAHGRIFAIAKEDKTCSAQLSGRRREVDHVMTILRASGNMSPTAFLSFLCGPMGEALSMRPGRGAKGEKKNKTVSNSPNVARTGLLRCPETQQLLEAASGRGRWETAVERGYPDILSDAHKECAREGLRSHEVVSYRVESGLRRGRGC